MRRNRETVESTTRGRTLPAAVPWIWRSSSARETVRPGVRESTSKTARSSVVRSNVRPSSVISPAPPPSAPGAPARAANAARASSGDPATTRSHPGGSAARTASAHAGGQSTKEGAGPGRSVSPVMPRSLAEPSARFNAPPHFAHFSHTFSPEPVVDSPLERPLLSIPLSAPSFFPFYRFTRFNPFNPFNRFTLHS